MRGKRSKAYRKLLKQFELAFNFRQPYQVLIDADIVKDAHRFTMDLQHYLSNTLHGEVKILITQCSMRHLYAQNREPGMDRVIEKAKDFERRRCGHKPEDYPEPLSTLECLSSCVGNTNKHRYVVASQDGEVRAKMRGIPGVPLIYISRSVMILEPMASATAKVVRQGERAKFRAELKDSVTAGGKRKRDDSDDEEDGAEGEKGAEAEKKKKKRKGPKGPNPLAVKKTKKKPQVQQPASSKQEDKPNEEGSSEQIAKKKRKRKQKKTEAGDGGETQDATPEE